MATYNKVVTEGLEEPDDIRQKIYKAARTWTPQGSRITDAQITGWRVVTTQHNGLEVTTLTGRLTVEEELMGKAYVHFRLSITHDPKKAGGGSVVSLLYQAFHSDYNKRVARDLEVPYCILGAFRPWNNIVEAFAWSMSDYIELITDPDEVTQLRTLSENM